MFFPNAGVVVDPALLVLLGVSGTICLVIAALLLRATLMKQAPDEVRA